MSLTPLALWPAPAFGAMPASPPIDRAISLNTADPAWLDGFSHPIVDATHLVALLLLGFAAAQLGGSRRWGLLVVITALMTFGIVLAAQGAVVPVVDVIVLTTALCFALLILAHVPPAFAIIATTAGAFALFHGVADGARALPPPSLIAYVCGFLVGNVVLYGTGLVAGEWFRRHSTHWIATLREAIGRWRGRLLGA